MKVKLIKIYYNESYTWDSDKDVISPALNSTDWDDVTAEELSILKSYVEKHNYDSSSYSMVDNYKLFLAMIDERDLKLVVKDELARIKKEQVELEEKKKSLTKKAEERKAKASARKKEKEIAILKQLAEKHKDVPIRLTDSDNAST